MAHWKATRGESDKEVIQLQTKLSTITEEKEDVSVRLWVSAKTLFVILFSGAG